MTRALLVPGSQGEAARLLALAQDMVTRAGAAELLGEAGEARAWLGQARMVAVRAARDLERAVEGGGPGRVSDENEAINREDTRA